MNAPVIAQPHEDRLKHRPTILNLPLDRIRVLNPRSRSKKAFAQMTGNIASLGLKRPVTVTEAGRDEAGPLYDLVCGQGRLEALRALGAESVPCMVIDANESDQYLISLVENIARRKHSATEMLAAVRELEERGYSAPQIAQRIDHDVSYVYCILFLLREGEARVLTAVERGWLTVDMALAIVRSGDAEIQRTIQQAYEDGTLRGEDLYRVRKLMMRRQHAGKAFPKRGQKGERLTAQTLLQTYAVDARKQQLMLRRAQLNQERLLLLATAMRHLLADEHFRTLLRAEKLLDMPKTLADLVREQDRHEPVPAHV